MKNGKMPKTALKKPKTAMKAPKMMPNMPMMDKAKKAIGKKSKKY